MFSPPGLRNEAKMHKTNFRKSKHAKCRIHCQGKEFFTCYPLKRRQKSHTKRCWNSHRFFHPMFMICVPKRVPTNSLTVAVFGWFRFFWPTHCPECPPSGPRGAKMEPRDAKIEPRVPKLTKNNVLELFFPKVKLSTNRHRQNDFQDVPEPM